MNKPRLIDANELVIETKKCLSLCQTFKGYTAEDALKHFLLLIDEQPTAYDIDKVVERLEAESYDSCHIDLNTPINRTWQIIDLDKAIEIVKGGADNV